MLLRSADTPGSRNIVGISNHAINALIDRIVFAGDAEIRRSRIPDDLVAGFSARRQIVRLRWLNNVLSSPSLN
jgi:hypothetical protein